MKRKRLPEQRGGKDVGRATSGGGVSVRRPNRGLGPKLRLECSSRGGPGPLLLFPQPDTLSSSKTPAMASSDLAVLPSLALAPDEALPRSRPASTRQSSITLLQRRSDGLGGEDDSDEDDKKDVLDVCKVEEDVEASGGGAGGPPVPSFPDGGVRGYLVVAGGTLVLFSTFGMSNAYGAFQAQYETGLLSHEAPSDISWIGSVHLGILFVCGLPSGRLFDDGFFRYQLAIGSSLWAIGIFMLSLSKTYIQILLSQGVCLGLALGIMFSPTISCVGSYFLKKRALMMGCTAAGAAGGATLYPIVINHLVPKIGFGGAVRVLAYIQCALLIVANIIMRPRVLPPKKHVPVLPQIATFLRQPSSWLIYGGSAMVMLGLFVPLFFIQVFAQDHGASGIIVEYSVSIMNSGAVISRLLGGVIADRWGILNTGIPVTCLTAILIFLMLVATSGGGIVAFCLLYGLLSGAWVAIMAPGFMALADNVCEIGVRAGLGFLFVAITSLVGSPIAGAVLRASGSFTAVCVFGGGAVMVGSLLLSLGRVTQVRRKKNWKV